MPRQGCVLCNSPKRSEIDALILEGVLSFRDIAARFGSSGSTVKRHKDLHLLQAVKQVQRAATEAEQRAIAAAVPVVQARGHAVGERAKTLLEQLHDLQRQALRISVKAESAADFAGAISGVREMRRLVELLAKMTGELEWAPPPPIVSTTVNVGVLVGNPDWQLLQRKLISALQPYPDAREAVLKAIRSIEEPPPPPQSEAAAAQVVDLAVIGPGPNRIDVTPNR